MAENETIVRFNDVSFSFDRGKVILDEASFSVRKGMKVALMGQNGAGKSTIFKIMTGGLTPNSGEISIDKRLTVSTAQQAIGPDDRELTVEAFFQKHSGQSEHQLKRSIHEVLGAVKLHAPLDKIIKSFSGGQQARLLLASALIQNPDLLLLDEPTNNLDRSGIEHLTNFLINFEKSCIIISHDAEFLNAFTEGVLYLDNFTHKIEQYQGNYYDVVAEIAARIEKENRLNARMAKGIQENKDKANFFAQKGGKMRLVAKKMRERSEELESEMVAVRKEDKTIRKFSFESQEGIVGPVLTISSYTAMQDGKIVSKVTHMVIGKNEHLLVIGPNGIGKSTFIESVANGTALGAKVESYIRIGLYRQDFSTLNPKDTVYESLTQALKDSGRPINEEYMRATAAGFLITPDLIKSAIGDLSEGQKGLVSLARLVLIKPGLLIADEPTNHINFRHLPVIAEALNTFEGTLVLVSHVPEFVSQIRIDRILDLSR